MTQGRPPKPKSLDALHGNPGKRTRQDRTLPESTGKLGLPRGLHKTVKRHCSAMAKYLIESGVPIAFVRPIFDRYCRHLQLSHENYDFTRRVPPEPKDGDDYELKIWLTRVPRAEKLFKDNSEAALKLEKQLESIIKAGKPAKETENPLEAFLKKGKKLEAVK